LKLGEQGASVVGRRRQPWPAWLFTAALALAVGLAWPAVAGLRQPAAPWHVPLLVLAAGFAAGHLVTIRFEFSGETHSATLSEVPLLIGLVFAPTNMLLVATVLGTAIGALWRRQTPIKAAFNIAARAAETVVAAVCFDAVLGHARVLSTTGWLAAFVAVPAANLASAICVQIAIALSTGRFDRARLKPLVLVLVGVAVLNVAVGRVAVAVLWDDRTAGVAFLGIVVVLGLGYRAYSDLRRRHGDLEQIYDFSRAVSELDDADQVIHAVLGEAKTRLRSERAELFLQWSGGATCYTLIGDGRLTKTDQPGPHPLHEQVAASKGGILAPRGIADPDLAGPLLACGFSDAVAVAVVPDKGLGGTLVVANRLSDGVTFEAADLELLGTLGNHTEMALRSCRLLDRLRKEVEAKDYQALHDALTGLGNRTLFTDEVDAALAQRRGEGVVALMLMDLDRFKDVNDTLGHHTGDVMLQQIAAQLAQALGNKGSVARLGGDEFAFVIPASTRAEVAQVARDILAAGQATVLVEGLRLEMRASLGVAIAPDHGTDRSTLLRHADIAMYHAKTNGTGIEYYQPERDRRSTRRLLLAGELRLALETSALELHYQPQAEMLTGRVSGVEALLRWTHPVYGTIAPDEFIPLAEQCGLIRQLTLWALEVGLTQLATWRREGLDLTLAANLSPRSVFDAELADELDRLLAKTEVPPGALILEITESSILGDRPQGQTVLDHLADVGVRLAIDDFGTGFSSLSRLSRLPVHEVKIDKSFVTSMLTNDGHDAIVRSTIDLARNLKLRVVAEGVENERTWIRLARLGCDAGQGYFLSRSLRASELASWLWQYQRQDLGVVLPLRPVLVDRPAISGGSIA
jgi:diguanylate cyclase (GGDEF)-like protein